MKPTLKFQIILIILTLLTVSQSIGQSNKEDIKEEKEQIELSKHSIYLDSNAAIFSQVSINYEHRLITNKNITFYGRVGAGYGYELLGDGGPGGIAGLTMLTGKKNGHFEVNLGAFLGLGSIKNTNTGWSIFAPNPNRYDKLLAMPLIDIGYRYQKPGSGIIFKVKLANIGLGIGVGYAF